MDCAHNWYNFVAKGYHMYQDIWKASYGEALSCALYLSHDSRHGIIERSLSDLLSNVSCCGLIFMDDRYTIKIYMPQYIAGLH